MLLELKIEVILNACAKKSWLFFLLIPSIVMFTQNCRGDLYMNLQKYVNILATVYLVCCCLASCLSALVSPTSSCPAWSWLWVHVWSPLTYPVLSCASFSVLGLHTVEKHSLSWFTGRSLLLASSYVHACTVTSAFWNSCDCVALILPSPFQDTAFFSPYGLWVNKFWICFKNRGLAL